MVNLDEVKKTLLARKNELETELTRLSREKVSDDQVQDPGDQAATSTLETLRNSLQDAELQEYNRILKALAKIENGTYGVCADCGDQISEKRLKSFPNATRCVVCQEAYEDRQS